MQQKSHFKILIDQKNIFTLRSSINFIRISLYIGNFNRFTYNCFSFFFFRFLFFRLLSYNYCVTSRQFCLYQIHMYQFLSLLQIWQSKIISLRCFTLHCNNIFFVSVRFSLLSHIFFSFYTYILKFRFLRFSEILFSFAFFLYAQTFFFFFVRILCFI